MKTLFIADLHLSENQPKITQRFLRFLETEVKQADALYILGDFFNLWVGDDDDTEFNRNIIKALRECVNVGVPIYFMPGNRDFLIKKRFLKASGCQRLADPSVVELYGKKVLLSHGDIFCTHNVKYLIYRGIIRNNLVQKLTLWLPLSWRKNIGQRIRKISQAYTESLSKDARDVSQKAIERIVHKYGVNLLIHGHVHKAGDYQFDCNGRTVRRLVLAGWDKDKGDVLVIQPKSQGLDLQFVEIE
jgi:UDP-2,3-diacylglucosamine hydrolase